MNMFREYYELTKPGIIYGNAITTAGAFLLASKGHIHGWLLLAALVGLSLVIASGCVLNNCIDRDIDALMPRTQSRALPRDIISVRKALIFAVILGLAGFALLAVFTNWLTFGIALFGTVVYVAVYSPMKKRSAYAAIVGSIAGAVPPVVGYCAVTARFDAGALILFLMLCIWQIPHFYAIAIRRAEDYAAASIPVLPLQKGIRTTKIHMVLYSAAFLAAALSLYIYGYAGKVYAATALLFGLGWFVLCLRGFKPSIDEKAWAKSVFLFSLLTLTTLFMVMAGNAVLP